VHVSPADVERIWSQFDHEVERRRDVHTAHGPERRRGAERRKTP
jgi:hypothetical protein